MFFSVLDQQEVGKWKGLFLKEDMFGWDGLSPPFYSEWGVS